MVAYKQERLDNAVAYFAKRHREIVQKPAFKTYIFKYITLFDFAVLKETGRPAFDTEYAAFERGPVPIELYDHIDELTSDYYSVEEDENGNNYFEAIKEPQVEFFSDYEVGLLEDIVREYVHPGMKTEEVIDATHKKIKAWDVAWSRRGPKKRVPMDYQDEMENILDKDDEDLTPAEEAFLVYRGMRIARATACWNDI